MSILHSMSQCFMLIVSAKIPAEKDMISGDPK